MNYKTKEEVQRRVLEHYEYAEKAGYEVVGVFLQGSFNYGDAMTDEFSDVDTKCLVLPTLEDLVLNRKPKSFTHVMENDEHCDVKDVRLYVDCFKKQNVNFVEVLFTEYFVLNPKYADFVKELKKHREEVARYNEVATVNCMLGMAFQKQKALCHPYEGLKEKLAKYGYDGKQLSHALRMKYMLEDYLNNVPYEKSLKMSDERGKFLTEVKRNKAFSKDTAVAMMDTVVKQMKEMVNKNETTLKTKNKEVDKLFEDFLMGCFKTYLKEHL